MKLVLGDIDHPQVLALLQAHLDGMHATSPPEHVHALDVSGLKHPSMSFWSARNGGDILGCGALKELSKTQGEIKSMRTHSGHLRKGVAAYILEHILKDAKARGYSKLSLETGRGRGFDPALKLYLKYGFQYGEAFGNYEANEFSQFLHLNL